VNVSANLFVVEEIVLTKVFSHMDGFGHVGEPFFNTFPVITHVLAVSSFLFNFTNKLFDVLSGAHKVAIFEVGHNLLNLCNDEFTTFIASLDLGQVTVRGDAE